jgi:site-specific DNA-methyltransferase (adenine-specific)
MWASIKRILKANGVFVTTASQPFSSMLVMSNLEWFKYEWVWSKNTTSGFLNATHRPLVSHEVILVFAPGKCTYNPQGVKEVNGKYKCVGPDSTKNYGKQEEGYHKSNGEGFPWSVQTFDCDRAGGHTTQKPVPLFEYLIKTYTNEGDIVIDPCMGSGTTGLAAIRTSRRFVGIEKDADIFSTAEARIRTAERTGIVVGKVEKAKGFWKE